MKALVAFATANGSTEGVAQRFAERLRSRGILVDVVELGRLDQASGYDAIIAGSAIHNGVWLPGATKALTNVSAQVGETPVWLFSVCSIGATSSFFPRRVAGMARRMRKDAAELEELRQKLAVQDHRYFAGAIGPADWSKVGNLFLRLLGGKFGDHRDWADIDAWADGIAKALTATEGAREVAHA